MHTRGPSSFGHLGCFWFSRHFFFKSSNVSAVEFLDTRNYGTKNRITDWTPEFLLSNVSFRGAWHQHVICNGKKGSIVHFVFEQTAKDQMYFGQYSAAPTFWPKCWNPKHTSESSRTQGFPNSCLSNSGPRGYWWWNNWHWCWGRVRDHMQVVDWLCTQQVL